jgi:MSHA biogenesis protein MshP
MNSALQKQKGNMIVMALFVIVVVSLLAAALINIISASSSSTIHQVYGLRAHQAAKAGLEDLLFLSFPPNGNVLVCNTTAFSGASFSNVSGLNECEYQATCVTETISFNSEDRLYFRYTSTGTCQINDNVVSRTMSVDAVHEISP